MPYRSLLALKASTQEEHCSLERARPQRQKAGGRCFVSQIPNAHWTMAQLGKTRLPEKGSEQSVLSFASCVEPSRLREDGLLAKVILFKQSPRAGGSLNPPFRFLIKSNGLQINVHLLEHHLHGEGLWGCKLVSPGDGKDIDSHSLPDHRLREKLPGPGIQPPRRLTWYEEHLDHRLEHEKHDHPLQRSF